MSNANTKKSKQSDSGSGSGIEIIPHSGEPNNETVNKDVIVITTGADVIYLQDPDRKLSLNNPKLYLNRELTWLNFNRRVLFEAENTLNPLLERVKFHAIASSNTDEFFMKRIGGLKELIEADIQDLSIDGRTPVEQLDECFRAIQEIEEKKSELYYLIVTELKENGILLLGYQDLNNKQKTELRDCFSNDIFPLITPQSIGPAHPFPVISNLSLNLFITLRHPSHEKVSMARIKIPVGPDIPRFIQIGEETHYVKVEEVVVNNLDQLFPGVIVESCDLFRVTRNANTEKDEEQADDLLELIESELRERKFAPFVRLQITKGMDPEHLGMICNELSLNENEDVFEIRGMIGKRDLIEIAELNVRELRFKPHHPIDPPRLKNETNIFYALREDGPILLYHPYESFSDSVERFLREASVDPKVRAIKMTLYRTSSDTNVVNYLINATRNNKQVTVVVELKARFDEAANIQWASQLEEMGIHVTYGVIGFKTHSKVIVVVRKDYDGLRIYSHIGTGNYHAGTARTYTDFGLLTADPEIGHDLIEFFNFLTTGYTAERKYKKILMAPGNLKKDLIAKIEREIKKHTDDNPGLIQMKMNALDDKDIVQWLYRASQSGVKVDLIVRDTCRVRPGLPEISENIQVKSIVGRYLEHGRLYYFRNSGDEEYYIGSADAMQRNLEKRVEVLVPIEDPALKKDLRQILNIQLEEKYHSWIMQSDGSYIRDGVNTKTKQDMGSQTIFAKIAEKRNNEARKIKRLQSKGKSKKENWAGYH